MEKSSKLYEKTYRDKSTTLMVMVLTWFMDARINPIKNIHIFLKLIEKFHDTTIKFLSGIFFKNQ